jgi:hypothetical protein
MPYNEAEKSSLLNKPLPSTSNEDTLQNGVKPAGLMFDTLNIREVCLTIEDGQNGVEFDIDGIIAGLLPSGPFIN